MWKFISVMAAGAMVVSCSTAGAGVLEATEPAALASIESSEKTQIFILASPHLGSHGEGFNDSALDPLLEKLTVFAPDVIAVEAQSARVIIAMQAQPERYDLVLQYFAQTATTLGDRLQAALDVEADAAESIAAAIIAKEARDHRNAAAYLLAAYDLPSAILHWSYLAENERNAGGVFSEQTVEELNKLAGSSNETYAIGVTLAMRLKLQRLNSIDDHLDKDEFLTYADELQAALTASTLMAESVNAKVFKDASDMLEKGVERGDLLDTYRFYNSSNYGREDVRAQWDIFLRTRLASGLDRRRLAHWEVRNLNIASHIRRASAANPGGRILVIIGAGHKPFLDAYLSEMMDVRIVPASEVLGELPLSD